MRVIAVDWSGAAKRASQKIWLAECRDGDLVRLEAGRDRKAVVSHLIELLGEGPSPIVGLDFAFSLPAWFVSVRGAPRAPDFWNIVADEGERWLASCAPPFWGRPGRCRPSDVTEHFRRTESALREQLGLQPKSTFQIGGAGAVGTGSLRGMPALKTLRDAGYAVWPFDDARGPTVIEIYPRILTGPVVKSNQAARERYLVDHHPSLPQDLMSLAASNEDAFDAAVSALAMARSAHHLIDLRRTSDRTMSLEGEIWVPSAGELRQSRA